MSSRWSGSLTWIRRLGIKFGVLELSWGLLPVSGKKVVEPGRNPHSCVQALLPETGILEEPGGVQDPCVGFLARVQPPLRPSIRVDLDESEDASVVRQTCFMNSLQVFVPGTLGGLQQPRGVRARQPLGLGHGAGPPPVCPATAAAGVCRSP